MSYSIQRAVSDGTLDHLDISIEYFDREEISVLFDGVVDARQWAWVGAEDKTISFTPAVDDGVEVTVRRTTDLSDLRHAYSEGAMFTTDALDESFKQVLHIAQEAKEGSGLGEVYQDLNFHGFKAINVGDGSDPMDAVNHRQMEVHDATIVGYMDATEGYKNDAAASAAAAYASEVAAASIVSGGLAGPIHAAPAKGAPAGSDEFALVDSASAFSLKRITWTQIKAAIRTAMAPLYSDAPAKPTPVDADTFVVGDSASAFATKYTTWSDIKSVLKQYFDTLYGAKTDVNPPVRQTVLSGPVDSAGMSAFGGSTGSTSVTAAGTLTVAAASGTSDVVVAVVNPTWTSLNSKGTMYLYIDISSGGVVTQGRTTVAPVYQWGGTPSVVNGVHTFNIQEMKMYAGDGSAAAIVNRVFVGEVTVAGSVVTGITWYSLMGRHDTGWYAVAPGSGYTKQHNTGVFPLCVTQLLAQNNDGSGWCVQAAVQGNSSGYNQGTNIITLNKLSLAVRTGPTYIAYFTDAAGINFGATTGYARQILSRGW